MIEREPIRSQEYRTVTNCRSCNSTDLEQIMSLGQQNIVGFSETGEETIKVPLTLMLCGGCHLLQLKHTTSPDLLWGGDYWYRSGVNQTMRQELADIAAQGEAMVDLKPKDIVVDIGSNDGTLLASYKEDVLRVGFDPARNMVGYFGDTLRGKDWKLFIDYFRKEPFIRQYEDKKAKIVTAISMFYDLDNPNGFLEDVKAILHPDGVFIVQQNYLGSMLEQNALDNICHEHCCYYSLTSLEPLLAKHGLEIFHVTENDINGGSFRTYIRHQSELPVNESVAQMKAKEAKLAKPEVYRQFAERLMDNFVELDHFLRAKKAEGKTIYVYGASTRGNTLLQFCGFNYELITGAAERNLDKWGLKTVGTRIPIVSEEEARQKADYFLVLPWHFKREFLEREKEWLAKGGHFVFPLPEMEVV